MEKDEGTINKWGVNYLIDRVVKKVDVSEKIKDGWKVDKVKFQVALRRDADVVHLLICLEDLNVLNSGIVYWKSNNFKEMSHNFNIPCEFGNVYVGIGINSPGSGNSFKEGQKVVRVEYNPQKVNLYKEVPLLRFISSYPVYRIRIMQFDMAFDILDVCIDDVEIEYRHGLEKQCTIGTKKGLETIYRGAKGENGAIKVYDKVKELNKVHNEIWDEKGLCYLEKYTGMCTRVEITIKIPPKERFMFLNYSDGGVERFFFLQDWVCMPKIFSADKDVFVGHIIENYNGSQFANLYLCCNDLDYKITDNRTKKKARELYSDIKKELTSTNSKLGGKLVLYRFDNLHNTLTGYFGQMFCGDKMKTGDVIDWSEVENEE